MMTRTRFAPAPTGFLHLGHVVNAIYVWGFARAQGAQVLLRIEDHDAQRCRPVYERALLDDLEWLGFEPDIAPAPAFRAGASEFRQSDRAAIYRDVAGRWIANGLVYGCTCTRHDLGELPAGADGEVRYPGTCRDRGLAPADGLVWRMRIDAGAERFDDIWRGPRVQDPASQCGDVAIRDRLGNWTYQFVASVDDHLQGIDLVVRGEDLLASTGRQIRLATSAGRARPARFGHHPLIMKSPARKLSKSDGDTGVRDLRAAGWTAPRLIGEAAWRAGLADAPEPIHASEVGRFFAGTRG